MRRWHNIVYVVILVIDLNTISIKHSCILPILSLIAEAPGYMRELLTDRMPSRNLRSHSFHMLHVPRRKLKYRMPTRNLRSHSFHRLHVPRWKLKYGDRAFIFVASLPPPNYGTVYSIILSQQYQQLYSTRSSKPTCLNNILDKLALIIPIVRLAA